MAHKEIERKAWLTDKEAVLKFLVENAEFIKKSHKTDTYYYHKSDKQVDFINDPIFRLRTQIDKNGKESAELTFKVRRIENNTEVNTENNLSVSDPDFIKKFADYIKYEELITKEKFSEVYKYKEAAIEINTLTGLGDFIEIEIIQPEGETQDNAIQKINEIFADLNIPGNYIETKYYVELLLEKRKG